MVWGFIPVMFGVLCQVASIAEASSLVPLAGAQYVRCSRAAIRLRMVYADATLGIFSIGPGFLLRHQVLLSPNRN